MEEFTEYIGYVVVLLVYLLPRILKWLAKRSSADAKPPKPKKEVTPEPVVVLEEALEELAGVEVDDRKISASELEELAVTAQAALARADEVVRLCQIHGGSVAKLLDTVQSTCANPLRAIVDHLASRRERDDRPDWDDAQRVRTNLGRLDRLSQTLQGMVERRVRPDSAEIFGLLDTAAQECLVPFITHARRLELSYPTRFAAVVYGEPGEDMASLLVDANIAPVVIKEKMERLPHSWIHLASDTALDVFHSTGGLARRIAADLAVMPAPMSLNHYSDQGSFIAGLFGGWLPRLFADTCAALMLGPGFAAGLRMWQRRDADPTEAVTTIVGDHLHAGVPPLHVRMFVACRVLQHLRLGDEGPLRWSDWNSRIGSPQTFVVVGTDGRSGELPVKAVLQRVSRIVDYLMDEPLAPLGGFILPAIPSLICDERTFEGMNEAAERFANGEPVDVPGRVILGAALLAAEKSQTMEQRIASAALHSLAGEGEVIEQPAVQTADALSLREHVRSRELLVRAIVTGAALAPRTGRRGPRPGFF